MRRNAMLFLGIFLAMTFAIQQALAYQLPDTGQTKCYDDEGNVITCPSPGHPFYGQDANFSINPPSYTKLDSNGNDLSDSAASWAMVRDNVTRLIWEVKTDDGSVHDKDNTYTWYDPSDPNPGTPGDGTDTDDFLNALNAAHFGGYSDWRLPTIKELAYVVDYSIPYLGPTINTTYFPNTVPSNYWSSTTYANYTYHAWYVYFNFGSGAWDGKSTLNYVRAVRGAQSPSTFVDNGNGTVTDTSTGLMWQQDMARDGEGNYDAMTWEEALAYCETRALGGYADWRLPNIKELRSLVDYTRYDPAINTTFFPNTVSSYYWSSTTYAYYTDSAWQVKFRDGYDDLDPKSYDGYVRAVRGGQSVSFVHFVESLGTCGGNTPCYTTIQAALNAAESGAMIKVACGKYPEASVWSKSGTVTISGGWNTTYTAQTGTTSMYAPKATGGGGVKVLPNIKVIAR